MTKAPLLMKKGIVRRFLLRKRIWMTLILQLRHQVVVIDNFQEWLYLGSFGYLFLSHWLCHLSRVFIDPCNKSMSIGAVLGAIVIILHNYSFSTSIFSS